MELQVQIKSKNYKLEHFTDFPSKLNSDSASLNINKEEEGYALTVHVFGEVDKKARNDYDYITRNAVGIPAEKVDYYLNIFQRESRRLSKQDKKVKKQTKVTSSTTVDNIKFEGTLCVLDYFENGLLLLSKDGEEFKASLGVKEESILDEEDIKSIEKDIDKYKKKTLSKEEANNLIKELYFLFKNAIQDKKEPIPQPEPEEDKEIKLTGKISLEDQILNLVKDGVNSRQAKELIAKTVKGKLDEWGIKPHVKEIVVRKEGSKSEPKKITGQHKDFDTLLTSIAAKVNVAMVGPAGSGKTTAVKKVAEVLGLKFYSKSVSAQTGQHEFFGYQDANGNYVKTLFREAYENGGVFLLDEFDAGNPNVLAALNQATANGECAFADTMVERHEDFVIVMAGNTFGHGATSEYVGRNKIDAATLDRFVFIYWSYDEDFEMKLARNKEWCERIQSIRKKVAEKKIRTIISPRATLDGEKLLAAGMPEDKVLELVVYKGLSEEEKMMLK